MDLIYDYPKKNYQEFSVPLTAEERKRRLQEKFIISSSHCKNFSLHRVSMLIDAILYYKFPTIIEIGSNKEALIPFAYLMEEYKTGKVYSYINFMGNDLVDDKMDKIRDDLLESNLLQYVRFDARSPSTFNLIYIDEHDNGDEVYEKALEFFEKLLGFNFILVNNLQCNKKSVKWLDENVSRAATFTDEHQIEWAVWVKL